MLVLLWGCAATLDEGEPEPDLYSSASSWPGLVTVDDTAVTAPDPNPLLADVPYACWAAAQMHAGELSSDMTLRAWDPETQILQFYGLDVLGDGTWDYVLSWEVDADGNEVLGEYDFEGDGIADVVVQTTYEDGRWATTLTEWTDGYYIDSLVRGVYDDAGRLVEVIEDVGVDGSDDARCSYAWLDDDHIRSILCDRGLNGIIDDSTIYTWGGDELREVIEEVWLGTPDDGELYWSEISRVDDEDRLVYQEVDADVDGKWDRLQSWDRTPDSESYRTEERAFGETVSLMETQSTLADGWRVLSVDGFATEAGAPDTRWTEIWDWSCP